MSAISFSTHVEKEVDKDGNTWVNINLRGKWYVMARSIFETYLLNSGYHSPDFRVDAASI